MAVSTSQVQASSLRLQKILLSWDYWDLETCTEEGSGAIKELRKVPNTFNSIQVGHMQYLAASVSQSINCSRFEADYAVRSTFLCLSHWCWRSVELCCSEEMKKHQI